MKSKSLVIILAIVLALLSLPLIAMQFSNEVKWDAVDFLVMGILLLGTGFSIEFVIRIVKSLKMRIVLSSIVLIALILVWAELAVGIFGTPLAGS